MNKPELIEKVAARAGLTAKQAEDALEAFEEIVYDTLNAGGDVTLTGFGTFSAKYRSARMGVNPQNPTQGIEVKAVTVPKFKAGKTFKDALKGKHKGSNNPDDVSRSTVKTQGDQNAQSGSGTKV